MAQMDTAPRPSFDLSTVDNPEEKELLAEFDRRRKARTLMIPTDDDLVKMLLRRVGLPICLFGEDVLDRRERLRGFLSKLPDDVVLSILQAEESKRQEKQEDSETWYHQGPVELRAARVKIADHSLAMAKQRLARAKVKANKTNQEKALEKQEVHKTVQAISLFGSQVTGNLRTSFTDFSSNSEHIITSNWGGQVSIFSIPSCTPELSLQGHGAKVGCARFRPGAYESIQKNEVNAASCDFDGNVNLWSLDNVKPVAQLENHGNRVSKVAFHPSGNYLGSTCHDKSWRLFDLETQHEILFQEGHSDAVYDLAFHPDGSLALSGSFDSYGRVWDLRTGRCIMFLEGHLKDILTVQWHPNGFVMITGSGDNQCKTWDIRMRRPVYTIPAHTSNVTGITLNSEGELMVTSSYDKTLKLWTTSGWQPLRTLEGHHDIVTSVQMSSNNKWIASSCADKTVKLWTTESMEMEL